MTHTSITLRLSSLIWFVTGAAVALIVGWVVMSAWRVEAAPGDTDTTVVPITACRLVDTRPATQVGPRDTALGAEQNFTVDVDNASTECAGKVPAAASGLVLNVTAAQTSQRTFLTVWDSGPWPGTSSMNPVPGPPVPNAVTTKLSASNTFEVYNNAGSTHLIIDVVAYLTPSSLTELNDRIEALEAKTAPMSALTVDGHATVQFRGVNVQVVDGSGDTDGDVNGVGNLIVGYNEDSSTAEVRSGSHNLIIGLDNDYTSYGGAVFGVDNDITAPYATVTGGVGNTASGDAASVSGGSRNTASGFAASVSGGYGNTATRLTSSVSGGDGNTASGLMASVSGGYDNTASGRTSSVSGGWSNEASGENSSVSGGRNNTAQGDQSSILGGDTNTTTNLEAAVTGGYGNTASGNNAVVSGGENRTATGDNDWRAGDLFEEN